MVEGESTRDLVNGTYMRDYFNVYFLPHVNRWWNDFIDPPVYQRLWGYPRMIKTKSFEKNKNGYRINEEYYRGPLLASQIKDQGQNTFIFDEEEGTPTRILLKLKLKYFICKNDHSSYELCGYCIDFYQSFFGIYIDYFSSGIKFKGIEYAQMAYYLGNRVCYIPRESITIFWTGRTFIWTINGLYNFSLTAAHRIVECLFDFDKHEKTPECSKAINHLISLIHINQWSCDTTEFEKSVNTISTMAELCTEPLDRLLTCERIKGRYATRRMVLPYAIDHTHPRKTITLPFPVSSDKLSSRKYINDHCFKEVHADHELEKADVLKLFESCSFFREMNSDLIDLCVKRHDAIQQLFIIWSIRSPNIVAYEDFIKYKALRNAYPKNMLTDDDASFLIEEERILKEERKKKFERMDRKRKQYEESKKKHTESAQKAEAAKPRRLRAIKLINEEEEKKKKEKKK